MIYVDQMIYVDKAILKKKHEDRNITLLKCTVNSWYRTQQEIARISDPQTKRMGKIAQN